MGRERGSATLELVIVIPAMLLMIAAIIMAGRLAMAQQAMQAVANDAARAASLARTSSEARREADNVFTYALAMNGLSCTSSTVEVDTAGFSRPVGAAATVTADASCQVRLGDLSFPGVPGTIDIQATGISPIDTYRER
jgi:Flp pilus assembly protein TadG